MFISKKDLDKLKEELRVEFNGKIIEINNSLEETLKNWSVTPKKKKTE